MFTDTRIILFVVCILLYLVIFFYRDELSQWKERQKLHLKNYLQKHIFAHDINDNGEFIYDNNSLKSVLWDYLDNFLLAPSEAGESSSSMRCGHWRQRGGTSQGR